MVFPDGSETEISSALVLFLRGYNSHGEAKRKRRFHIIDCGTYYTVKKRFGPFWFYVRKRHQRLTFTDFGDVVRYVNERRRK